MTEKGTNDFLYAAINDTQDTIRAIDNKIGALLIVLVIPLTKLGAMYHICSDLVTKNCCSWILVAPFVLLWAVSFYAAIRTLVGIDNPFQHIQGEKTSGTFYGASFFKSSFGDVFCNREKLVSSQTLDGYLKDLPQDKESIKKELLFEHVKLAYIRTIKMKRMKAAYTCVFLWVPLGGVIWFLYLHFKAVIPNCTNTL